MASTEWICFYAIDFTDGTDEVCILHVGTQAECQRTADRMPAINYTGNKHPASARMCVRPIELEAGA